MSGFSGAYTTVATRHQSESQLSHQQVCATNVGFGDPDGKGLYITACNFLFRVRLNTTGVRPGPPP